jgi:hypothetical protein
VGLTGTLVVYPWKVVVDWKSASNQGKALEGAQRAHQWNHDKEAAKAKKVADKLQKEEEAREKKEKKEQEQLQ